MKLVKLIKSIPFISTLLIIILLSINNQKEYTKLRILIWNSPTLSLGTYLAISTGSGFIISYLVTTNLVNNKKLDKKNQIKYKYENKIDENNIFEESYNQNSYDKTLIERDINEPSPTIKANFRVIGKTSRRNESRDEYETSNSSYEIESQYNEPEINNFADNKTNTILNDWEDNSYSDW